MKQIQNMTTVDTLEEASLFSKEITGVYGRGEHKCIKINYDGVNIFYTVHHNRNIVQYY